MRPLNLRVPFGLICVLPVLVGCPRKPKTPRDQVSYAIGIQFGRSLNDQKLDLNPKAVVAGVSDAMLGERPWLNDDEMRKAVAALGQRAQEKIKTEAEANGKSATEFLSVNKAAPDVRTTATGLQYKILKDGDGPAPKMDDVVVVNYRATLIDGTEFDSSFTRKVPAEFPLRGIIPGWAEGIRLMRKGGKAIIYVPPSLGYGDRPRQQIPANAVLIFDVDLLDVKAAKPQPKK